MLSKQARQAYRTCVPADGTLMDVHQADAYYKRVYGHDLPNEPVGELYRAGLIQFVRQYDRAFIQRTERDIKDFE